MIQHQIARAVAATLVATALVACGADDADRRDGRADRDGKGGWRGVAAAGEERGKHRRPAREHGSDGARPRKDRATAGSTTTHTPQPAAASPSPTTGDDEEGRTRPTRPDRDTPSRSCLADPAGDAEGSQSRPAYADLTRGCLSGDRADVVLAATTAGTVPAGTPDGDTQLSYGFELTPDSGSQLYVYAQASPSGWAAYVTRGQGTQALPDPRVSGSVITLRLPVAALDGARRVDWRMESSWLQSTTLTTSYAFDSAGSGSFGRR